MDVESQLRDALDLNRVLGEPGFGFEERVLRSLPDRTRHRSRLVPAFVGLAAVLAIAVVAAPWYLGGTTHGVPAGVTSSPSASPAIAAPTATPVQLAHARSWGLEFDYPASWRLSDAPPIVTPRALQSLPPAVQSNYYLRHVLGYVGTTTPETVCTDPVHLTSGGWNLGTCSSVWSLGPDDVVLRFQKSNITGQLLEAWSTDPSFTMTTVGGLPALFGQSPGSGVPELAMASGPVATPETAAGAETVLVWQLPGNPTSDAYKAGTNQAPPVRIVVAVRGPNAAAIVAQVKAVVASIQYDPAVVPLPTDPAALAVLSQQALAATLDLGDVTSQGSMDCFARQPGSRSATITVAPDGLKLSKPLPVVCSVAIEPNIMQGWTITLTVTWEAASDRKAGTWTSREGQTFGSDEFPYEVPSGQAG